MSLLGTTAKARLGVKAAKSPTAREAAAKAVKAAPAAGKLGAKAGRPLLKRKARKQVRKASEVAGSLGEIIAGYAPELARQLGYVAEPPKKRTLPRVLVGAAIGAVAMYLFEPEHGRGHREQVRKLLA